MDEKSPMNTLRPEIRRDLTNRVRDGAKLVQPATYYPITMVDLHCDFVSDVLPLILPTLETTSVIFLGLASVGESPVSHVLAFAMSRLILKGFDSENVITLRYPSNY